MAKKAVDSEFSVDARPIGEGKDPLAEGNTLVNPKGSTEDDNVYELLESSEDVRKAEATTPARPRATYDAPQVVIPKIRSVHNKSEEDLAKAIKTSKRTGR